MTTDHDTIHADGKNFFLKRNGTRQVAVHDIAIVRLAKQAEGDAWL